ncbi:MAG: hypothetical protein AB1894_17810 [Chloroflexota bacterium]
MVRSLYAWEVQEARRVFAASLQYERVRVHENTGWPDSVNQLGMRLKGIKSTVPVHNAITLGNHCYFPVQLLVDPVPVGHPDHGSFCWLIHELTHAWQYQHMGWRYLGLALYAQFRYGAQAYVYGEEEGLRQRQREGWKLSNFNLEQQGDIARNYYERLCTGQDVSAWLPFITDLQQGLS